MKVTRQDRAAQQVDSEVGGMLLSLALHPAFSVVEVLPADRIIAQQEASTPGTIHHMHASNFVR